MTGKENNPILYINTFLLLASLFFIVPKNVGAQELNKVNYPDGTVVDSDLDGLTDEGEKQIYHTDPLNPDTDGDGYLDGAEVIGGSNPLDPSSPGKLQTITNTISFVESETPWAWYTTRVSGLVGFFLLFASIFLGVAIRLPFLQKIIKPSYSYSTHCWISLQAVIFAFIHGASLLFDKYLGFNVADIFVPLALKSDIVNPIFLALGIIGFYLMIVLVVTSYLRKYIGQKIWRLVHFLNIILYIFVIVHAYFLGTDMKNPVTRDIFLALNGILILLFILNIIYRLRTWSRKKIEENYENNSASYSPGSEEQN
jgi:DMSO/TMAO reductase YedYZ heme-binding membrane subunit